MYVTLVDVGKNNVDKDGNPVPLQIVCGAQNFNQGDHIVTAMIGAVLPGDFKIKKSKLRGVESCGMNCSSRELGLGDDQSCDENDLKRKAPYRDASRAVRLGDDVGRRPDLAHSPTQALAACSLVLA